VVDLVEVPSRRGVDDQGNGDAGVAELFGGDVALLARTGLLDDRRDRLPLLDGRLDARERVRRVTVGHHRVAVGEAVRADLSEVVLRAVELADERLGRVDDAAAQLVDRLPSIRWRT